MNSDRVLDGLIIGGGITGLSLAHWLGLGESPSGWELWEATDRVGGTLGTDHVDGYSIDWGPNGFLDREPLTLQLVDEIGLNDQLEPANEHARKRYIIKNGRLHAAPNSPLGILTTTLIRPWQALRVCIEPFIPARRDESDESIYDFAARRIGHAATRMFIEPMVSGVFGGVAKELSLPACFPNLHEMEVQHGSLVRAMIANRRQRGKPSGPAGHLTSFRGGLQALTDRLSQRMQSIIRLSTQADQLSRDDTQWIAVDSTGRTVHTKKLVLACPCFVAASLLKGFDRGLSVAFGAVPYAPIIVVATGHRREDIRHPLEGFGFLVPRLQRMRILGSIWTSSIFAGRAPTGHVQLRTMLGGAGDPSVLDLHDDDLLELIRRELGPLIGMKSDPTFMRVYRWERGLPQYVLGHRERMERLERFAARHPGLYFAGNAYYGVGLNDCVMMAKRVADTIRR